MNGLQFEYLMYPHRPCRIHLFKDGAVVPYDVVIPTEVKEYFESLSLEKRVLDEELSRQRAAFESEVSRLSRRIAILQKENEHAWEVAEVLSAQVEILENERGL